MFIRSKDGDGEVSITSVVDFVHNSIRHSKGGGYQYLEQQVMMTAETMGRMMDVLLKKSLITKEEFFDILRCRHEARYSEIIEKDG